MMHEQLPVWYVKILIVSMFAGGIIGAWKNYKGVCSDDTNMYVTCILLGALVGPASVLILTFVLKAAQYLFS